MPCLWLFTLYAPALSIVPTVGPIVAPHLPAAGGVAALAYSLFNKQYVEGYMESAEGRLAPFYRRTHCFKFLIYGAIAGIIASAVQASGALDCTTLPWQPRQGCAPS